MRLGAAIVALALVLPLGSASRAGPAPEPQTGQPEFEQVPPDEGAAAYEPTIPIYYKEVEGWDVMIDVDMGFTCFVMGRFASGTTLRIGADRTRKEDPGYLLVANPAWTGFADATDYPITLRFDNAPERVATARASTTSGITALIFRFADANMVRDFSIHRSMEVSRDKRRLAHLDLTASQKAVRSLIACQRDVDKVVADAKAEAEGAEEKPSAATTA